MATTTKCNSIGFLIIEETFSFFGRIWQEYKGIFYAVTAAVCYSIADILIYDSSGESHPLIISLWISGCMFVSSLMLLPLLVKRPTVSYPEHLFRKLLLILALNGLMAASGDVVLNTANVLTSPGDAISINYTASIYAGVFSVILLRDRCRPWDVLFIIVSITGVALVVQPPFIFGEAWTDVYYTIGILLAVFGAVMTGVTFVVGSYLGRHNIPPLIIVMFISSANIIIAVSLCTIFQQWDVTGYSVLHVVKLTSIGVAWFLASLLAFIAVQIERPTLITIIMTSETFLVFIGEYIFLDLTPEWTKFVGAVFIVAACIGSTAIRDGDTTTEHLTDESADETYLLGDQT